MSKHLSEFDNWYLKAMMDCQNFIINNSPDELEDFISGKVNTLDKKIEKAMSKETVVKTSIKL